MKSLSKVAFIGNYPPRRCGIATFTCDVHRSVSAARPGLETCVVALTDPDATYDYPEDVRFQIRDDKPADYLEAADFLNESGFEVVSLQHEYGIFGGEAGADILDLLTRLKMPVVTTLHTVLRQPAPSQQAVMRRIISASAKLIVMSEKGREFLQAAHGVPSSKIDIIPHGIPDFPFLEANHAKAKFGFADRSVILTFGLLSPNKGIETILDAMPAIIKSCPNALYVVLGATHPNLVRREGEAYRDRLTARVAELGIENHVAFFNQFVDQATLLDFISMCDVYATPYLNEAQMTSGTLAYSFGLGKAIVSTPYWHAKELLGDGRGVLVPFGDTKAFALEIASLLTDDVRRQAMRERAYAASRSMTWPQTAKRYLSAFESARVVRRTPIVAPLDQSRHDTSPALDKLVAHPLPEVRLSYFESMCDSTGLLQHAVHGIPDRDHGYCVDDNARALLLSCALGSGEPRIPDAMTTRFAAFIQHAWNRDRRRFRNFMSYDRKWLEDQGSEDSHGRTLWALGECARSDADHSRRRWAASLFHAALPVVEEFEHLRAWTFTLLALDAFCASPAADETCRRMRDILAERLVKALPSDEADGWVWFEDVLAYDNARLPQALMLTGMATKSPLLIDAGLRSLRWLMTMQTAPNGYFRPVGNESFGIKRQRPSAFDQQPVEAAATISACLTAARVSGDAEWTAGAMRAFEWFLGANDVGIPLADRETGSCMDGLHPNGANQNRGAESVLSYLLGLAEIRQYKRAALVDRKTATSKLVSSDENRSTLPRMKPGSHLVPIPLLEQADLTSAPRSSKGRG